MISMDRAFSWALVGVAGSGVLGTYEPKTVRPSTHRMSYGCGCSADARCGVRPQTGKCTLQPAWLDMYLLQYLLSVSLLFDRVSVCVLTVVSS